jgi:NagD protein
MSKTTVDVMPGSVPGEGDGGNLSARSSTVPTAVRSGIGHAESFTDLPADVRPHLDLPDVGASAQLLRG